MPRVLITGSTGFVGRWMLKKIPPGVEFIGGGRGLYESGMMDSLIGITHIVHLAPVSPHKVVELAHRWSARLLYCSSGIVYYPERDTEYRRSKVFGEDYCQASGVDVVIARLFTFFGAWLDDSKAYTAFMNAARNGEPLKVHGDGSTVRTYMHGRDLGVEMWRILFDGDSGRAYDVGSRRKTTIKRLAERISAMTGAKIEYTNDTVPVKEYYPA